MARLETTIRKFNERFEKDSSGCWKWLAYIAPDGYGKMMAFGEQYAHRVSYILHKDIIPEGMDIMHSCDNPSCVNPSHLQIGTHKDNMADMVDKGRSAHSEQQRSAKLTKNMVIELRNGTKTIKDAINMFGVAEITAMQARRGITWKHLNNSAAPI